MLLYNDSIFLFRPHLQRLCKSAKQLGFPYKHLEAFIYNLPTQTHIPCNTTNSTHIYHKRKVPTLIHALQLLKSLHITNMQTTSYITDLESKIQLTKEYPHLWDCVQHLTMLLHTDKHNNYNTHYLALCRLLLAYDGSLSCTLQPLHPITNTYAMLAIRTNTANTLNQHKTTQRAHFKRATQSIINNQCFDYLYIDTHGTLTEGSRSNILIEKAGKYYTPASSVGLLEGTLRNMLLNYGICTEAILYEKDLYTADSIYCINSVRGIIPVCLMHAEK